jgi:hypothetical protein
MRNLKRTFWLTLFLCIFLFSGSAYALKFNGDAWFAQHYSAGERTGEYYLVIDDSDLTNIKKAKLKGFKLAAPTTAPDFFYLTGNSGTDGTSYYEIGANKGLLKKLNKKAEKKSNKLIKKGLLEVDDRADWMGAFVEEKLEDRLFKLVFKADGNKYKGRIGYATFENPVENVFDEPNAEDGGAAPVPEPGTMLLVGSGLIGVAAFRRRFK